MKCVCGYEEPEGYWKKTEVFWQSGKNKGKLKHVDEEWIEPDEKDKFIRITVEKDFSFIKHVEIWGSISPILTELYACPKCKTVRMAD